MRRQIVMKTDSRWEHLWPEGRWGGWWGKKDCNCFVASANNVDL